MGLGAIALVSSGRWHSKKEINRYKYQQIKYEKRHGPNTWTTFHKQLDMFM